MKVFFVSKNQKKTRIKQMLLPMASNNLSCSLLLKQSRSFKFTSSAGSLFHKTMVIAKINYL